MRRCGGQGRGPGARRVLRGVPLTSLFQSVQWLGDADRSLAHPFGRRSRACSCCVCVDFMSRVGHRLLYLIIPTTTMHDVHSSVFLLCSRLVVSVVSASVVFCITITRYGTYYPRPNHAFHSQCHCLSQ